MIHEFFIQIFLAAILFAPSVVYIITHTQKAIGAADILLLMVIQGLYWLMLRKLHTIAGS